MRVALIGEVQFSRAMFQEITNSAVDVVAICTRNHRWRDSDKVNLSSFADEVGVPSKVITSINDPDIVAWLVSLELDAIFCLGWSEILCGEVLNICPGKVIGYHPSGLPKHRGHHPLIWALALGLSETASSFFFMDRGADSGDIISQKVVTIEDEDYASNLYSKVVDIARVQVRAICEQLVSNQLEGIPQDRSQATYWRKRSSKDGVLDWRMSSYAIRNLVRALAQPYPGARFLVRDQEVSCYKACVVPWYSADVEPGKVLAVSDRALVVKTGDGAVELSELSALPLVVEGEFL